MPKRPGRKSAAQTPAPRSERKYGSKKNKPGSASAQSEAKITLSDEIVKGLEKKAEDFNEKHPRKKVRVGTLKKVFRRGAGAYSKSHRPFISGNRPNSRSAWSYARVNKFLKKKAGQKVKAAYVQDDDLLAKGGQVYNDKELLAKYKKGESIGFTATAHLKAKGLIPRADGTKRKSEKYLENGGLIAPNGKPSNLTPEQYELVRTPEFKAWFGDWENDSKNSSKVVDENGEPLVVYHGTSALFNKFQEDEKGRRGGLNEKFWSFTTNKEQALIYALDTRVYGRFAEPRIISAFLNIRDMPSYDNKGKFYRELEVWGGYKYIDIFQLQDWHSRGFNMGVEFKEVDGFEVKNTIEMEIRDLDKDKLIGNTYYVKNSNQIKLADGSNTTFDANNPDIRYEDGGELKRCTNSVFEAITGVCLSEKLLYGSSLLQKLNEYGYAYEVNTTYSDDLNEYYIGKPLSEFVNNEKQGVFYIVTSGHAIAYVNGVLTDTYGGLKKKILAVFPIHKRYDEGGVVFVRNKSYDNSATIRRLPYRGVSAFAVHTNDFEKFKHYAEKEEGVDTSNWEVYNLDDFDNYELCAMPMSETNDYVMGYSDDKPTLKKFDAEEHTMYIDEDGLLDYDDAHEIIILPKKMNQGGMTALFVNSLMDSAKDIDYVIEYAIENDINPKEMSFAEFNEKVNPDGKYSTFEIKLAQRELNKYFKSGGDIKQSNMEITCKQCGWQWNTANSKPEDATMCHKCGYNNVSEDIIQMNSPTYLRSLEFAREDAKEDVDLHKVTENAVALSKAHPIRMDDYDELVQLENGGQTNRQYAFAYEPKEYVVQDFICMEQDLVDSLLDSDMTKIGKIRICQAKIDLAENKLKQTESEQEYEAWYLSSCIWRDCMNSLRANFKAGGRISGCGCKEYKDGGLAYGNSHAKGGMPMTVKNTGQNIEIEGGEGVVNKRSMQMKKEVEFQGKKMTPCEVISSINEMGGGVKFKCEDVKKIIEKDGEYD